MRKFIISDIHGLGNIYNSIMNYLDNISKGEDIELYINGDLFDRGLDSVDVLLDIKQRIMEKKYPIIYLGGNHELLMYQFYKKKQKNKNILSSNDWYKNGGKVTAIGLKTKLGDDDKIFEVADFVSNLKIYHRFEEKINGKNILLVHAASPLKVSDECNLRIKDDNLKVFYYVWAREEDFDFPFRCRIGNRTFFTIVGHTPNDNKYGYVYDKNQNYLNIDGGCAPYAYGYFKYDHVPLIEIKDNYLQILTFNNNNQIIYGNYFDGNQSVLMKLSELDNEKKYLNDKLKPKKLIKLPDDTIKYED